MVYDPHPSSDRNYALSVFIGKFSPFHIAHLDHVRTGLRVSSHVVVILGSAFRARSIRMPFLTSEREAMVRACLTDEENKRVTVVGIPDSYNDIHWAGSVERAVIQAANEAGVVGTDASDIVLLGHDKDATSYYLRMFPHWSRLGGTGHDSIDATDIRLAWLQSSESSEAFAGQADKLPAGTLNVIYRIPIAERESLQYEYSQMLEERRLSKVPTLTVTSDGVVIQSGHVLLVERHHSPGQGLLSLPGGKLRENLDFRATLVRNLVESQGLMCSPSISAEKAMEMVDGYVGADEVFDHPARSERGRAVSRAFLVELPPSPYGLYPLRQGAEWHTLAWLQEDRERMFEDHAHIIETMVSRARRR